MVTRPFDIRFTIGTDRDVDRLLEAKDVQPSVLADPRELSVAARNGAFDGEQLGVIWVHRESNAEDVIRPIALVGSDVALTRLCSRYAQLRGDLSPISPWCHLLTPSYLASVDSLEWQADLGDAEAAWSALVVAEAILWTELPLSSIRIQTCLATESFAVARTQALWRHVPLEQIHQRFQTASTVLRSVSPRHQRTRSGLAPVWEALVDLTTNSDSSHLFARPSPIAEALRALRDASLGRHSGEASELAHIFGDVLPEASEFYSLEERPAEARLCLFDALVKILRDSIEGASFGSEARASAAAFLAGYLATVAAGGVPSLGLLEPVRTEFPQLVAWAYVAGSMGERVFWTSGFDGLGRLVARELLRPLRLDEPPHSDFSLDEAVAVVDTALPDPLVRLRIKQAKTVTVGMFPGVNVSVPLAADSSRHDARGGRAGEPLPRFISEEDRLVAAAGEAVRPLIRQALEQSGSNSGRGASHRERTNKRRHGSESQLRFPKK